MSQTGGVRSLSNSDGQSDGSQVIQQKMWIDWIQDMGYSLHFTDWYLNINMLNKSWYIK
jgi:hypothetical protein